MTAATPPTPWTEVAIIGAGAVGRVLAQRLVQCGYAVSAVLSRSEAEAAALAQQVNAPVGTDDMAALPFQVPLVVLCVPDDAIAPVARRLAALERPWDTIAVAHTSGAHSATALDPLADCGAATFSLHPMQTITTDSDSDALDGIYFGLEGQAQAVAQAVVLVRDLGAQALTVPSAAKTRYHLAGVLASNGLVALMGLVNEVLASVGIDPDDSGALMGPLIQNTWANLAASSPDDALTGPVKRGDLGTVVAHLDELATHLPHLLPTYAALSNEMVRLAVRSGQLSADQAEPLLNALHDALHRGDDAVDG